MQNRDLNFLQVKKLFKDTLPNTLYMYFWKTIFILSGREVMKPQSEISTACVERMMCWWWFYFYLLTVEQKVVSSVLTVLITHFIAVVINTTLKTLIMQNRSKVSLKIIL